MSDSNFDSMRETIAYGIVLVLTGSNDRLFVKMARKPGAKLPCRYHLAPRARASGIRQHPTSLRPVSLCQICVGRIEH